MWQHLQISSLDLRLCIMAAVLAAMGLVFHALTGNFLTPENLYNIAQQTAVVGIVATAMALVIVARHIDLSVGSVIGVVGVLIAFLMYTHGWHWTGAALAGLALALAIGLYQGWLSAYLGVPSFVVTLGGLMTFRGAAFLVADGKTQPVTDELFLRLGGGYDGGVGVGPTWVLAAGPVESWSASSLPISTGVCPFRLMSGIAPACSSRAPSSRRRVFTALSTAAGMS